MTDIDITALRKSAHNEFGTVRLSNARLIALCDKIEKLEKMLCEGCAKRKLCDPAGLCKDCGEDVDF